MFIIDFEYAIPYEGGASTTIGYFTNAEKANEFAESQREKLNSLKAWVASNTVSFEASEALHNDDYGEFSSLEEHYSKRRTEYFQSLGFHKEITESLLSDSVFNMWFGNNADHEPGHSDFVVREITSLED